MRRQKQRQSESWYRLWCCTVLCVLCHRTLILTTKP